MDLPISLKDIESAEALLAAGELEQAATSLEQMRDDVELYIDSECETKKDVQYFSFENTFELLAYRRIENDPRKLIQVGAPFDRMYADLAFVYIQKRDYERARDLLMQAVRWNPMNCRYRLDLAELFRALGDKQEWAALSNSVVERASDAKSTARAYTNLGLFFLEDDSLNAEAASACARLAAGFDASDERVSRLFERLATEHPEVDDESDDHVMGALSLEGIRTAPSPDIAVCLVMCATDAAKAGDTTSATNLTLRARDLFGEGAVEALTKLIRENDADTAAIGAADGTAGEPSDGDDDAAR